MTASLDRNLIERLTRPGLRLSGLEDWLMNEVWTQASFEAAGRSPQKYLVRGETLVNERENLLRASASSLFNELASEPAKEKTISSFLARNSKLAVVVFDGCSLREMPRLLDLAKASGREVLEYACSRAAVPSETEYFISERLGPGLPSVGPSRLSERGELKQKNIRYYYYGQTTDHHTIQEGGHDVGQDGEESFLLWSRFPDQRYTDSSATSEAMFDGIWDGLEQAWKRTVQAVPPGRTVLVTSDHGYIFLGSGLSDPAMKGVARVLDGGRFRLFDQNGSMPEADSGLYIDASRKLAVMAGRGHNRFPGPNSQSIYRHGGLTLMEMLTPWIVLGPVQ